MSDCSDEKPCAVCSGGGEACELAKVRAKSEERRRLLEEIGASLVGAHESACVPTWTKYDRHEPNSMCEYIEPIAAALKDE